MARPVAEINALFGTCPWVVTRSYNFAKRSHINLLEGRVVRRWLTGLACDDGDCRPFGIVDSRVTLGYAC